MPRSANLSNTSLITYDDIRVEDLEDEYSVLIPTGNLKEDFRSLFNKELSATSCRRVHLVAQHSRKPATTAKLLGRVLSDSAEPGQQGFALIARFVNRAFDKFQQEPWRDFAADWREVDIELSNWRSIAPVARNRVPH